MISSDLPVGCGLGSSAAFNVATAAACLAFSGLITPQTPSPENNWTGFLEESLQVVNNLAFEMERFSHGNPSGVDNSTSTFGGAITFESGKITRLPKFPDLRFLVAETGVSRNTKQLVKSVKERVSLYPQVFTPIIDSIEEISNQQQVHLSKLGKLSAEYEKNIVKEMERLICVNHDLLNALGVGHESLEAIHRVARACGFACKMTGAGGGGCAIVFLGTGAKMEDCGDVNEDEKKLKQMLRDAGVKFSEVYFGCAGVKLVDYCQH